MSDYTKERESKIPSPEIPSVGRTLSFIHEVFK